jgi:hypothetical protein
MEDLLKKSNSIEPKRSSTIQVKAPSKDQKLEEVAQSLANIQETESIFVS